jgi:hypothetical protein
MRTGELSEPALDLLLTDIMVWPVRVVHHALGRTSTPCDTGTQPPSWPSWDTALGSAAGE